MPGFLLSKVFTRALIVVGVLALVAAWRLDRAVKTAYESGWVASSDGLRLPTMTLVYIHAGVGCAAVILLLGAVLLWRHRAGYGFTDELGPTSAVIAALTLVLAVVALVLRFLAATDSGWGKGTIALVAVPNLLALVAIGVLALVIGNLLYGDLAGRLKRMFERQRMNLVVVLALVVALTLLGDTSGQAIDSIRSWSPLVLDGGEAWSQNGAVRLTLGLAAALLIALVLYESGVRLSDVTLAANAVRYTWLLPIGLVVVFAGGLLWWLLPFGPGILLAGLLLLVIGLLDLPDREGRKPTEAEAVLSDAEKDAPEWIAMLPLVALAAISVTATVEAALSGGLRDPNTWLTLLPACLLGSLAVFLTRRVPRRTMAEPRFWRSARVVAGIVVASLLVLLAGKAWLAALYGLFWTAFFVGYAMRLFHLNGAIAGSPWQAYSMPIALGGGFAVFLGIHVDPLRAGRLLGVFTVTLVALAFVLVLLHFAVRATLRWRPPRLLWWFGLTQLPVLTLVLVWWIGVGVAQTYIGPKTLHDARLVDRREVEVEAGEDTAPRLLTRAFDQWVRGQEDLARPADEGPVPLVLVAAHGGGIRAAYWTAAALDCIVGVSAEDADPADFVKTAGEDVRAAAREATCTSRRRTELEQRIAAKRIFLASGVSGGAVGLYAYARQLLHFGELVIEPESWINLRLGADFAGATVAWGLFHDVPNRLFGLHPDTGAPCELFAACWRQNRAAVLEQAFDDAWRDDEENPIPSTDALLRHSYDLQFSSDQQERRRASLLPVLVMNSTLTGGKARAVVSAADLGSWPNADALDPQRGDDRLPLAGTVEVRDALCESLDMRLSTAALLAARFPYVTPSGRIAGQCGSLSDADDPDAQTECGKKEPAVCEGRYVDGGYADNSGLFTIVALYPSLRELIVTYNVAARGAGRRQIAPMIVEIDNHYQASIAAPVPSGGSASESFIPLETGFGSRRAMETYARAAAYRILPESCTVTVAPSLHPGLIAPLGWELSKASRADLRDGLVRPHPDDEDESRSALLRQVQSRIAAPSEENVTFGKPLDDCLPRLPPETEKQAGG